MHLGGNRRWVPRLYIWLNFTCNFVDQNGPQI